MSGTQVQRKKTVNLLVGALLMLLAGLLYAWSIFRGPLTEIFPQWTASQVSLTFTISMVCYCLGVFFAGKLSMRIRARTVILMAAVFLLIGFFGLSRVMNADDPSASLLALYLLYGVFCGAGAGMVYNAVLNSLTKWFPGKAGTVSGILLFCYGLGGIILGGVVDRLVAGIGLFDTLAVLGIGIAAIVACGAFVVRPPNASEGRCLMSVLESNAGENVTDAARKDHTLKEMVATPVFWLFCLWNFAIVTGGLLVMNSAAPIAVVFGAPAILGLIASIFSGVGRFCIGSVFDLKGRNTAMLTDSLIMVFAGAVLLFGAQTGSTILVIVGLSLAGLSYGGAPPSMQAIMNNYFGAKNYAVNMSVATFSVIPAAIIGPMISSTLQERSGGYGSTFIMFVGVAVLAVILNALLRGAARKTGFES